MKRDIERTIEAGGSQPSSRQRFGTLVITSDPQYPWTEKTYSLLATRRSTAEHYYKQRYYGTRLWMENIKNEGIT
ncbi:hypothetical protein ABNB59_08730 [Paenibacillus larvae]|uniref:Uncharacterized protein n=1 Tax=Paenibacillus larvae TaxID=1464 RepID=A0AAP5JTW8_9BACL|nr:hypothetical protein [Paenibacillus larvae]AQR78412.1 hypothetical protein BXP28_14960 [Paenibacillus larvae subsp. larvae]AVF20349.1 hypothetical protein ERICI_00402 [Paenibacillus larvae subsp. larvae]ETK28717.1 hypothetical protein ERIC1_1c21860 [Paenibacillus larvae subsp. larvae DSM 25719]MCY7478363.1 hypothetical protein [Paenibacillus larvae]MCY7490539.1 hypothetical protein [Paenibacillus larvae]